MTDSALLDAMRTALAALEDAPAAGWDTAADTELHELIAVTAALRKVAERHAVLGAGEVARRSTPDRGLSGFVQRAGYRTVEEFLKAETGVTGRDAATSVRVGSLDGVLGDALREGRVSVPAAEAIRAGLGNPSTEIPRDLLDQAAARLCTEPLDPDRLHKRAREIRDELDEAGIGDRERARRAARSLRLVRQADGMTRIVWLLDPESAAIVTTIYDRATSPRRGGPRFTDPTAREKAARLVEDDRTTEQLASDAFTELLRQTASVDQRVLLGGDAPAVQVLIAGYARHGVLPTGDTVSLPTVRRIACAGGILPVTVDHTSGQVLNMGRTQRLFTRVQRRALALRDGGCLWPGCDRPPSWTEAHHIRPWSEGGRTDLTRRCSPVPPPPPPPARHRPEHHPTRRPLLAPTPTREHHTPDAPGNEIPRHEGTPHHHRGLRSARRRRTRLETPPPRVEERRAKRDASRNPAPEQPASSRTPRNPAPAAARRLPSSPKLTPRGRSPRASRRPGAPSHDHERLRR